MSEIPASCNVLHICGQNFHIDDEVRKEVESFLHDANENDRPMATLLVSTISGEDLTIIANAVAVIYSTSPESRAADRMFTKLVNDEAGIL